MGSRKTSERDAFAVAFATKLCNLPIQPNHLTISAVEQGRQMWDRKDVRRAFWNAARRYERDTRREADRG